MTRKHKIYFFFWKIAMYLKHVKRGTFVSEYESDKKKDIKGVIIRLTGDSVTKSIYSFSAEIQWFEPFQGTDYRYFCTGSYDQKSFKDKITII